MARQILGYEPTPDSSKMLLDNVNIDQKDGEVEGGELEENDPMEVD